VKITKVPKQNTRYSIVDMAYGL